MAIASEMAYTVYKQPGYLMRAAKRKYGLNIVFIGAEESKLNQFWSGVKFKASGFSSERPQEISRAVVDITAKEHVNKGEEPADTIEILNAQEGRPQKKTYSLSFQIGWEFGYSIDVGASFFNTLSTGEPSLGLGESTKKTTDYTTKEEERSLSQQYGVTGKMTVAPKSKLKVEITTYTVNYKIGVQVRFFVHATTSIPIYYKCRLCALLCSGVGRNGVGRICCKSGAITAEELFQMEDNYNNDDRTGMISFTKDAELSYLCEVIEMHKEEYPI